MRKGLGLDPEPYIPPWRSSEAMPNLASLHPQFAEAEVLLLHLQVSQYRSSGSGTESGMQFFQLFMS